MELIGVLLGLVIAGLIVAAWIGNERSKELASELDRALAEIVTMRARVTALEKRKPASLGSVDVENTVKQQQATARKVTMRTWNENIGAVEAK